MRLNDFLYQASEWLKGTGPNSDIVISSRIRLARNIEKIPFPHWANRAQQQEVLQKVFLAVKEDNYLKNAMFLKLSELDSIQKQFLVERHLMSQEHALKSNHKALVVTEEEIVSIMINEEDHLRIQVMQSGFDLTETWRIINKIDDSLSEKLNFAYSSEWGYLTACPTNTGTGLRGSVMLHLPALVITRQINKVLQAIAKLSFTTRGLYGEGTQATGNLFQISNQVSLGHKEEDIIDNLIGIIHQVIEQEKNARDSLIRQHTKMLEDRIWRAYGTLKSAHIISSQETIELLSMLRLGMDLGIIKDISRGVINELLLMTQPAHLQMMEAKKLTTHERDIKRAELIRSKLK